MKLSMRLAYALLIISLLFIAPLTKVAAQSAMKQETQPLQQTENAAPIPSPSTTQVAETEKQNGDDRLPFLAHDQIEAEAPSAGGLLLRTLGALLLIVGLIVAAAWGMKRFGGARFGAAQADAPELRVLASVALGDKRSLAIVRFGERNLLVGSTAQSITLLAEDAEEMGLDYAHAATTTPTTAAPPARSVAELLQYETIEDDQRSVAAKKREPRNFAGELSIASARFAPANDSPQQTKGTSAL